MAAKTKVCCISDLHGNLPQNIPECDLLIIAGDICPNLLPRNSYASEFERRQVQQYYQMGWWVNEFKPWIYELIGHYGVNSVAMIPGNHDFIFENQAFVQEIEDRHAHCPMHLLIDRQIELPYLKLKVWGSPWCNKINGSWAFEASEEYMEERLKNVPLYTDIIISHGPAFKLLDYIPGRKAADDTIWPEAEHVGSEALLDCILRVRPKLLVCGHIHESYGITEYGDTIVVNASLLDVYYNMVNKPIVVEI